MSKGVGGLSLGCQVRELVLWGGENVKVPKVENLEKNL